MHILRNINIGLKKLNNYNSSLQCARCVSSALDLNYYTALNSKVSRTSTNIPREHTHDKIGMWYTIEPEKAARLFKFDGLTMRHKSLVEVFNETSIMIREPAVTMIDYVNRSKLDHPPNKFLLYGKNGTGKTMALAHVIHHLTEEGWLVIHSGVPAKWSTKFKEIVPSTTREGFYDHTIDASIWLQQFRSQNEKLLETSELVTSQDHQWTQRDVTPKGSPVLSIVDFGIGRSRYATECIFQLFNEYKQHANEGRVKVAVVIDGINALFLSETKFKDANSALVGTEKMTLFQAFLSLLQNDWKNGVIVGSVDAIMSTGERRESYLPRYLLRKRGWETLDPFVPIKVDKYTEKEFESAVNYYLDRKWLQHPAGCTREGQEELAFLSGYYPLDLIRLVNSR